MLVLRRHSGGTYRKGVSMFVVQEWGVPQWTYIIMLLLGIGISAARSGKEVVYSAFGVTLTAKIIQNIILVSGGFYRTIGWPQVVWVIVLAIELGNSYRLVGQKTRASLLGSLLGYAIAMFLLVMGGFFA